jgi:hypothetical protein
LGLRDITRIVDDEGFVVREFFDGPVEPQLLPGQQQFPHQSGAGREPHPATGSNEFLAGCRTLRQSMEIRTFVATTENAVRTRIWKALIVILLVKSLQLKSTFDWSLSNLVPLLRHQLFVCRDLFTWLNNPLRPPPALEGVYDAQMTMTFAA